MRELKSARLERGKCLRADELMKRVEEWSGVGVEVLRVVGVGEWRSGRAEGRRSGRREEESI